MSHSLPMQDTFRQYMVRRYTAIQLLKNISMRKQTTVQSENRICKFIHNNNIQLNMREQQQ
jgi:hypothetical protein